MALRFDRGSLRAPRRDERGALIAEGYATRIGVFEYYDPRTGKTRRELRLPEDVFAPKSLGSYENAPVTDDHAPEHVTPQNVRQYQRGTILAPGRRDGEHVAVKFSVAEATAISHVLAGKHELSVGYDVELEERAGVHPEFGRYDAIQRNIVVNHLAIVDAGRAGPTARIRMDALPSGAAFQVATCTDASPVPQFPRKDNTTMDPEKLQEQIRSLGAQLAEAEAKLKQAETRADSEKLRADTAEGRAQQIERDAEELRVKANAAQAAVDTAALQEANKRADTLQVRVDSFDKDFEKRVRERATLERKASVVMGDGFRMDALSDREIMATVVKHLDASADVSNGVADGVILGRFQTMCERHDAQARSYARASEVLAENTRRDAAQTREQKRHEPGRKPLPSTKLKGI
jgi:uncharacterized protein